jgi:hypothetical protein
MTGVGRQWLDDGGALPIAHDPHRVAGAFQASSFRRMRAGTDRLLSRHQDPSRCPERKRAN